MKRAPHLPERNGSLPRESRYNRLLQTWIDSPARARIHWHQTVLSRCNMTTRAFLRTAVAVLSLAQFEPYACAQTLYGSLVGNITDPSGAAIPNARVSAVNDETGFTRETVANDRGAYSFSDLQAGQYTVNVSAGSFAAFAQRGVRVSNNAVVRVDMELQLSTANERVNVTATGTILQTDRSDVRTELNSKQFEDL